MARSGDHRRLRLADASVPYNVSPARSNRRALDGFAYVEGLRPYPVVAGSRLMVVGVCSDADEPTKEHARRESDRHARSVLVAA